MTSTPIRIAPVAFLNAAPLAYGLESHPGVELKPLPPAAGATALAAGEVDAALVPVAALVDMPNVRALGGWCIGAHGPVLSVLAHGAALKDAARVALDANSRTSNVLLQVLLQEVGNTAFSLVDSDPDLQVVIGDAALGLDRSQCGEVHDLAQLWFELTGRPFVFALWAVHESSRHRAEEIRALLNQTAEDGLKNRSLIAEQFAGPLNMDPAFLLSYLENNLHYHFGPEEQEGLKDFLKRAHGCKLLGSDRLTFED